MGNSFPDELAAEARARRGSLRLSQRELAELAGVSERFVRFVEQGKRTVQLDSLLALLDTLGLELRVQTRTSAAARALAGPRANSELRGRPGSPAMRHRIADIYKAGVLAARLERHDGGTRFSYLPAYLASGGPAVASSLPLTPEPVLSAAGAAPPYFTGLLPEGRRLNALRRSIKTSVDDELSLLIAAGANPVGDVQIVGHGEKLDPDEHAVELDPGTPVDFEALLGDSGLIDPVALAGVQDKLSAGMISMPVASAGRRYILKLNAPEFPHVVENEYVMFRYAARLRIPLSRVQLIRDVAGRPGLLVERFDRVPVSGERVSRVSGPKAAAGRRGRCRGSPSRTGHRCWGFILRTSTTWDTGRCAMRWRHIARRRCPRCGIWPSRRHLRG